MCKHMIIYQIEITLVNIAPMSWRSFNSFSGFRQTDPIADVTNVLAQKRLG